MFHHLDHISLFLLPLLFLLIYQLLVFRKTFSVRNTLLIVFVSMFVLLHVVPSVTIMSAHHQQQSPSEHHPCCIPQMSEPTHIVIMQSYEMLGEYIPETPSILSQQSFLFNTQNRSPPILPV